ncbi:MAG: beta-mannosidase [Bacteroidaceae bacterium]|nr:beta-mannosidase [Bacteroidaceae bacterium]
MKRTLSLVVVYVWSLLTCVRAELTADLCNPNATQEAKHVFAILNYLYGERIVSGTVANVNWNIKEAQNVYKWTKRYPALNVFDFIQIYASKDVNPNGWIDYSNISVVSSWWNQGGLVGAMWHWNVPTNDGTGWTCTPGNGNDQSNFDPQKAVTVGTEEYARIIQDLDQVAGYLKKLQSRNIPVLWRPLYEAAGNTYEYSGGKAWFWWGIKGADTYKKLWQLMYDRFVNYHGLNNLIWVWTSQVGDKTWYPGDEYVDIIGRDNYGFTAAKAKTEFNKLKNTFPNHMVVLAECGHSSNNRVCDVQDMWDKGAKWGWFMTWYDYNYNTGASATHQHTDAEWWQTAWDSGIVVDRAEMKELLASDITGIENLNTSSLPIGDGNWYDLTGRRIANPQRSGVYIMNGKKVVIK